MALRQQVWVDKSVQGVLVGRVILYWFCALLYVGIGSACFQYNQNPDWTLTKHAQVLFSQMWPWLPTAIILLPLAIYDVVRLSNLFAGPIFRLRKHFDALRQDIACSPLTFREDDHWRDLAAPINDMQAEILRLRSGVIELQQVASHTTELMANLTENLVHEPAATNFSAVENQAEMRTGPSETYPELHTKIRQVPFESVADDAVQVAASKSLGTIAPAPTAGGFEAPLETPTAVLGN